MKIQEWKRGHHLLHNEAQQGSANHRMATAQDSRQVKKLAFVQVPKNIDS